MQEMWLLSGAANAASRREIAATGVATADYLVSITTPSPTQITATTSTATTLAIALPTASTTASAEDVHLLSRQRRPVRPVPELLPIKRRARPLLMVQVQEVFILQGWWKWHNGRS